MPERRIRHSPNHRVDSAHHLEDNPSKVVVILSVDGTPDGQILEKLGRRCSVCPNFSLDMRVPIDEAYRTFARHRDQCHPDDLTAHLGTLYRVRIDPRNLKERRYTMIPE